MRSRPRPPARPREPSPRKPPLLPGPGRTNRFTESLLAPGLPESLLELVRAWDAVEAMALRVHKRGGAEALDESELLRRRPEVERGLGIWGAALEPLWRVTLAGGIPASESPFQRALRAPHARDWVGDWGAMQHLPAAREALNRLVLQQRAAPPEICVVYDDQCEVCARFQAWVQRGAREGAVRFVGRSTLGENPAGTELLGLQPGAVEVLLAGGEVRRAHLALPEILARMPGWGWVGACLRWPWVSRVSGPVYRWVSRNRWRWGGRRLPPKAGTTGA